MTVITRQRHAMDEKPTSPPPDPHAGTIFTEHRRTQFFVTVASVLGFLLFWWGGKWIGIPAEPGFSASLLQQNSPLLAIVGTYVLLVCAVIVGTLVSGRAWFYGGLFAALIGLMALSARGGPMRYVLFKAAATDPGARHVFLMLFVEQGLLFLAVGLLWTFFWRRYEAAIAPLATREEKTAPAPIDIATALLIQFAVMTAVVMLLARTDAKKQVLVAVFLGGLGGTTLAEAYARKSNASVAAGWFWVGPCAVGAIGYLIAYFASPTWMIGDPNLSNDLILSALAALARPLPLDYASAGAAGALLGYWLGADRPRIRRSALTPLTGRGPIDSAEAGTPDSPRE